MAAPRANSIRSPLNLAIKIEKVVHFTSKGVSAITFITTVNHKQPDQGAYLIFLTSGIFTFLNHHGNGIVIQGITDRLNLGQNKPSFGRLQVDGNHHHHQTAGWQKVPQ